MLCKIRFVGVCGSDIVRKQMGYEITSLGHELVVEDVGGNFYAVNPLNPCSKCDSCTNGQTRFCSELKSFGKDYVGGFSGGDIEVPKGSLYALPNTAKETLAIYTLADPLACVLHGITKLDANINNIVVFGDGVIACLASYLLADSYPTVQVVKHKGRVKRVTGYTARIVEFDKMSNLGLFDNSFIAVGGPRPELLNRAITSTRPGGTVVVAGSYHKLGSGLDIKTFLTH